MNECALQPQNTSCVSLANWDIKGISKTPLQNFKASNIQYSLNYSTQWVNERKQLASFLIKGQWEMVEPLQKTVSDSESDLLESPDRALLYLVYTQETKESSSQAFKYISLPG